MSVTLQYVVFWDMHLSKFIYFVAYFELHSLLLPNNVHSVGRPLLLTHAVTEAGLGCRHSAAENTSSVTICVHVCFYCME